MTLNEAVETAVTEWIKKGILAEFLKRNRAEVVAMSIFEFDAEKEWKLIREAEYRYGVEIGTERGEKYHLVKCVFKKLRKGKDVEKIAEELEEDIDQVKRICEVAGKYAPDYNESEILKELELIK